VLANTATSTNTVDTLVRRDGSGNFAAGTITANLSGNATTATTATNFSGSLAGDVTGTQGATVVSVVGGQTAANVAAGTVLANTATSTNTVDTLVRRDSSGNFAAGTITASLIGNVTGNASGNVLKAGDTMTGTLVHPAGTAAAPSIQFTGSTNTGISAATANRLSFDTDGAERMAISNTDITALTRVVLTNLLCNQALQVVTVSGGQNVAVAATTSILLLKPSAAVSITVTFPASPTNGQYLTIVTGSALNRSITITYAGNGATVLNGISPLNATTAPTAAAGGGSVTFIYYSTDNTWYRINRG
jgi:trimeric autotransporter adhesin